MEIAYPEITVLDSTPRKLGEGLMVSSCGDFLGYVDIIKRSFILLNKSGEKLLDLRLNTIPSSIFELTRKSALLLDDVGILRLEFSPFQVSRVMNIEPLASDQQQRGNDGALIRGEFWFGSMGVEPSAKSGLLYVIRNGQVNLIDQIGIPNTFVELGDRVLISDSLEQVIYAYDFETFEKTTWADLSGSKKTPDGGFRSATGNVFVAMWGDQSLVEFTDAGEMIREFRVSALNPTNCCEWNGKLVVTSAQVELPDEYESQLDGQTFYFEK